MRTGVSIAARNINSRNKNSLFSIHRLAGAAIYGVRACADFRGLSLPERRACQESGDASGEKRIGHG